MPAAQATIKEAQGLIQQYGVLEGILIYIVILTVLIIGWNVYQQIASKKIRDQHKEWADRLAAISASVTALTSENQVMRLDTQKELARIELMVNDRVRHEWVEKQLVPKIDRLSNDVAKLSTGIEHQVKSEDALAKSIQGLTNVISNMDRRVSRLEDTQSIRGCNQG